MRDLVRRVCTGYIFLLSRKGSNYPDRLNAVIADARERGEYLGGYRVRLGEGDVVLDIGEADSVQERGGSTPRPQDDGEIVEAPPQAECN